MIAVDTETTGLDFWHGTAPFFVSTCDHEGNQRYWEWAVDPKTRRVQQSDGDAVEIADYLHAFDEGRTIWHNAKFDFHALRVAGVWDHWDVDEAWRRAEDTIVAAHLIDSSQRKSLTALVAKYLGHDIETAERSLRAAVDKARRICRSKAFKEDHGEWAIADEARSDMPSAKGAGSSGADYWLPRELWRRVKSVRGEHPEFQTVLREYANADTAATLALWRVLKGILERGPYWGMYRSRVATLPVLYNMECNGVTVNDSNMAEIDEEYCGRSRAREGECLAIARNYRYDLQLPRSGRNGSLDRFILDVLKLPPIYSKKSKTGGPTLDKNALGHYRDTLREGTRGHRFVESLLRKRKVDSSIAYMEGYRRFGLPTEDGFLALHPSINPVGTDVTRRSSSAPNEQNIPKKKDEDGRNVRFAFGPAPGREWWSMDYQNLELRIPAYHAGERTMIELFERPDDPPYFGSNHLFCAHVLWPKEFEQCLKDGTKFDDVYKSTLYAWTKNGNFAVQYGAMAESGTADRAYHQAGAQLKIQSRLGRIAEMNREAIEFANRHGYVRTLPERDLGVGYPVSCPRGDYGRVKPTIPLSYVVQGTAGRVTERALQRCHAKLRDWNAIEGVGTYQIAAEIHDEIVFDFPARGKRNLGKISALRRLMEASGDDIGVPLKVDVSYHPNNWLEDQKCA